MLDLLDHEYATGRDLNVSFILQRTHGEIPREFILHNDIVIKELVTHTILVSIQSDWNHAILQDKSSLVGTIQGNVKNVHIDQSGGTWQVGMRSVMKMGTPTKKCSISQRFATSIDEGLFLPYL